MAVLSDVLVRDSLLRSEEQDLYERASQQATMVRRFRDGQLRALYEAAARNGETFLNGNAAARRSALSAEWAQLDEFSDLSLVDADGQVLASTQPEMEGQDLSGRPWLDTVRQKQVGVSHCEIAAVANPRCLCSTSRCPGRA